MMVRFALLFAILVTGPFGKPQEVPNTPPKLRGHPLETGIYDGRIGRSIGQCHFVLLDSDNQILTSEQLRQSVAMEPEFTRRGFALPTSLQLPDVRVHLGVIRDVVQQPTVFLQAWNTTSDKTTQENFSWPGSNPELVVAAKVVSMLSKLCGEPKSAELQQRLSGEQIAESLRSFRRVQLVSRTYLAPKRLEIALGAREEIGEWGISISSSAEASDVALIVDHFPSIVWGYQLVDSRTGVVLDSGKVFAFQEKRAASRIAETLISHVATYRQLQRVRKIQAKSGLQNPSSEQFGSWRVTEIVDTFENPEPVSRKIILSLQPRNLMGSTSEGQSILSIDVSKIVDVAFDDSAFVRVVDDPWNCCTGEGGPAELGVLGLALLLHEVTITKFRVHIAWNEENLTRIVSLQASKGDLRKLFDRLAAVVNAEGVVSDIR
jgi:hypothetical protein